MHHKKLVLFDLDGVLLDSRSNMERAWAEVKTRLGVATSFDEYFSHIGLPFQIILGKLGLAERGEQIETVFRATSSAYLDLAVFYPDVESTLIAMSKSVLELGIVTSKDATRTNAVLDRLPIEFSTVQTPNGECRGKPAPDHFLLAMEEAGVQPVQTVYIGDMEVDFKASQNAGIDYIHAGWGYGKVPDQNCVNVPRISNLLDLFEVE